MTREEAIRQLDGADIAVLNRDFFKFNQAIIMAISALRQQEHFREVTKKVEPMTNADRIRAMSDEELADVLRGFATKPMQGSFLKWLQQPAEEADHEN